MVNEDDLLGNRILYYLNIEYLTPNTYYLLYSSQSILTYEKKCCLY